MPIEFRGITPEDLARECYYVKPVGSGYDIIEGQDNNLDDNLRDNARYYFPLCHYVINTAIAGNNMGRVYQMFGLTKRQAELICKFSFVWDEDTNDFISSNVAADELRTNILMGGDYIHKLIEDMTLEKFRENILGVINAHLSGVTVVTKPFATDGSGAYPLFEGFYINAKKGLNENTAPLVKEVLLKSGSSTISKMLAVYDRGIDGIKDFLSTMVLKHIVVIPPTLRPSRETKDFRQRDPIMSLYNGVFDTNSTLSAMQLNDSTIKSFIDKYRSLSEQCNSLLCHPMNKGKNYKSILEKLTGKHGQIRGSNLGKRLDYSGRSVIIVNPFLSIRKIRIPEKTIPKLYKYHALMARQKDVADGTKTKTALDLTLQSPSASREEVLEIIRSHNLLDIPIILGRQPTLHKGSMSSYEVEVTKGNAIELSPLICPPFNADFDGDQMWDSTPLSEESIEEMRKLTFVGNNLFWAKDGKPAYAPRQEIIYGLNMCTRIWDSTKGRSYDSPMTSEKAYDLVVKNRLKVYDKVVEATSGNNMTAGQLAFRHCIGSAASTVKFSTMAVHTYVCPRCLARKVSTEDECMCDKHPDTYMIEVFKQLSAKCNSCKKIIDVHKLGAYTMSKDKVDAIVTECVTKYAKAAKTEIARLKFCEALAAIEDDEQGFTALCSIMSMVDSLEPTIYAKQDETNFSTEQEHKDIIAHNKMCDVVLAYYELPVDIRAECISDIVPENFGKKTAKLINVEDTVMFAIKGVGFNCAKGLYDFGRSAELVGILQANMNDAKSRENLKNQQLAVDMATNCPECGVITAQNISVYVNKLLTQDRNTFLDKLDLLVKLGFKVAKYYAPSLNVLSHISFETQFEEFHKSVANISEMYEYGFVEDAKYAEEYGRSLEHLKESVGKNIKADTLGESNGFLKMVESGARGSKSNLVQIYGYKGRVTKSSTESFNAVIESSYTKQLSPIEHFMAAYGARRGIMDRSLETANTGYMSRQLWHATNGIVIQNCEDCGTKDGITLRRSLLKLFDLSKDDAQRKVEEDKLLVSFLTGRYDTTGTLITKKRAKEWVKNGDEFTIRSPITCKNPCCVKCYGRDLSTHDIVVKGTPVGIIAAEGIGETTSQLTMRTFQGGGVAKKGGISSAYDSMENYVLLKEPKYFGNYEPTAWTDGYVYRTHYNADLDKITIGEDEDTCAYIDNSIPTRVEVKKGEGIYASSGDQYIPEIIAYSGVVEAQVYYALKLLCIFRSECEINLKHFEVLAASVTRALVLDKKSSNLLTGCTYSYSELLEAGWTPSSNAELKWGMYKVQDIPSLSANAVANIDFEDVGSGIFNAIAYKRRENFSNPMENLVFGKRPKVGSEINPNYIDERANFHVSEDII